MRFLCIGAGAVGIYLGGSLMDSGEEVSFLVRPRQQKNLEEQGIHLIMSEKEYHGKPVVFSSLKDAMTKKAYDAILICVKSYDLDDLIRDALFYKDYFPPIISMLNGVENEEKLENQLGIRQLIAGSLTSAVKRMEDGTVILEKLRGVGLSSQAVKIDHFIQVFNAAGLKARAFANASQMKWSKMITNLPANATSAIMNLSASEVFSNKDLCSLEIQQLKEAFAVMRAMSLKPINLPGAPVKPLSFIIEMMPFFISQPVLLWGMGKGRGGKMPSFHIDLYSGKKKSEVDYLNGAVVRYGKKLGVPTPANLFLWKVLADMVSGKIDLDYFLGEPHRLFNAYHNFNLSASIEKQVDININ